MEEATGGFGTPEETLLGMVFFAAHAQGDLVERQRAMITEIATVLQEEDFGEARCRIYWRVMSELSRDRVEIDANTVRMQLEARGQLESCGGMGFLAYLVGGASQHTNYMVFAQAVRKHALLRWYGVIGQRMLSESRDTNALTDLPGLFAQAETRLHEVTRAPFGQREKTTAEALDEMLEKVFRGELAGISTGFPLLDWALTAGGFSRCSLNILAATTSVGKTSMATEIALRATRSNGEHANVVFLSVEMDREEMLRRLVASVGPLDWGRIARRRPEPIPDADEIGRIVTARDRIVGLPVEVFQRRRLTPADVQRSARLVLQQLGTLDLIIVDYLQLMDGDDSGKWQRRDLEIGHITKELKGIAGEFDCPVLLLSQLNREAAGNAEPQLWHLRESGAIEQDADVVLMLWPKPRYEGQRLLEINWKIAKQRNGVQITFKQPLEFEAEFTRFDVDGGQRTWNR